MCVSGYLFFYVGGVGSLDRKKGGGDQGGLVMLLGK